jgi:hypothetical protein
MATIGDVSLCVPIPYSYDGGFALDGRDQPAWDHLPSGRMSLLDMTINFGLDQFQSASRVLAEEIDRVGLRASDSEKPHAVMDDADRKHMLIWVEYIARFCETLGLSSARNRVHRIQSALRKVTPLTYSQGLTQLVTLKEAIEDDVRTEYFYHYPKHKVRVLLALSGEWEGTLKAFPSLAKGDRGRHRLLRVGPRHCMCLSHDAGC